MAVGLIATGVLSLAADRSAAYTPHAPIRISANVDFTLANGVVGGTGTPTDPYIISGWEIVPTLDFGIWISNTNAHFVIRDLHVNRTAGPTFSTSIKLTGVSHARVEYVLVEPDHLGIHVVASTDVELSGNIVKGSSPVRGVELVDSANLTFSWNDFGGEPGLRIVQGTNVYGSNNIAPGGLEVQGGSDVALLNNRAGIIVDSVRDAVVNGNDARSLGGIHVLGESTNVTVHGNAVGDDEKGIVVGYLAGTPDGIRILENQVENSTVGIEVNSARSVTIAGNTIARNRNHGLRIVSASYPLSVHHNNFLENSVQAEFVSQSSPPDSFWDAGYPSGGNYWSNYTAPDACRGYDQMDCAGGDGFGDLPFVVTSGAGSTFPSPSDRYPLMSPFVPPATPVASFSVTPPNGTAGPAVFTIFQVDASSSWTVSEPLDPLNFRVRWDWEADGVWDTLWSKEKTASHRYDAAGNYTISVEVRDPGGLTNGTSRRVQVTTFRTPTVGGLDWLYPILALVIVVPAIAVGAFLWRLSRDPRSPKR